MTVYQHDWSELNTSVVCPLCDDGTRIARDATAWRTHMEASHSADAGTWTDTGDRAGEDGPIDGYFQMTLFVQRCYGCTATFLTKALLLTHLSAVHSAE